MSTFKQVLDIEKKYENIISEAHSDSESKLSQIRSELKNRELEEKEKIKENFELEYKQNLEDLEVKGQTLLEESTKLAESIDENKNVDKAVKLVMEKVKNV